jgi:hypothetical protein
VSTDGEGRYARRHDLMDGGAPHADNARNFVKASAEYPKGNHWTSDELAARLGVSPAQLKGRRVNLGRSIKAAGDEVGYELELTSWRWDDDVE